MEILEAAFSCKRDDLTIRGICLRPKNKENPPAVIISHGYTSNHHRVMGYARQFARWGYAAFCFDFCGGCIEGESDGKTSDMSVLTEKEDLKAVIAYVESLSDVESSHLLLMGCSQGGFVSALAAAELLDKITALILFYPALCIPDDARSGNMGGTSFDPENIPDVIPGGPILLGRVYPESVLTMDPFEAIRAYGGPVFITHGTKDEIVNVSYSRRAFEAYGGTEDSLPQKQLLLIEGAAHGYTPEYDSIAIAGVESFLLANGLL